MAGADEKQEGLITGINVTPMVDVVLVLLIIFMATAPLIQKRALSVNVPRAAHNEPRSTKAMSLLYTADRDIVAEGRTYTAESLIPFLKNRLRQDPAFAVSLSADEKVPYGEVVELLDAVRSAGLKKVALDVRVKRTGAAP